MAVYLVGLVNLIVNLLTAILFLNAIMSWLPLEPWHPVRRFLSQLAEPIVRPFRNLVPPMGMFDLSLMVAMLAVQFAGQVLILIITNSF